MKRLDKSVSVILAVTMLVSLVGCDSFRNNNDNGDNDKEEELITQEAAVAVAEEYSKALIALDSAKIIELSSKISDSNSRAMSFTSSRRMSMSIGSRLLNIRSLKLRSISMRMRELSR